MDQLLSLFKYFWFSFVILAMGTYAGSKGTPKEYRRIGIPVVFFIGSLFSYGFNYWNLTILLQTLSFRLGHGVPSKTDKGSVLGRFFFKIFKGNLFLTNVFTRGILAFVNCLFLISKPIIKGSWSVYILCSIVITGTFAFVQWRNFGTYELRLRDRIVYCCKSDIICYGVLGLFGFLILFF